MPGTRTIQIDKAVEALYGEIRRAPLFKGYAGANPKVPFPACTCISINEQVVHGIPNNREIREGDVIKFDTACKLNGWCPTPPSACWSGLPGQNGVGCWKWASKC